MTPFYHDDWLTLYGGDCKAVLSELTADSVDCVVTSPPYWSLRDYGVDGQLGLERTPEEYVANMVAVFAGVRRVLKPSGTCWLNLGDSYAHGTSEMPTQRGTSARPSDAARFAGNVGDRIHGLKPKDLVGIPWRVAFALQADGWYLRSDIIWSKPNPMPESVTDRPTKSHEYLFLLTKSARYYFDADAVREALKPGADHDRPVSLRADHRGFTSKGDDVDHVMRSNPAGRNIRSVWTIATRPYPGAHFAVFPPELPERCIKAGSSERGVCPECGAPWERVVETVTSWRDGDRGKSQAYVLGSGNPRLRDNSGGHSTSTYQTTGWHPTCDHEIQWKPDERPYKALGDYLNPIPAVTLDPFAGSGTVGMVANRLSRRAILIDLNPEYLVQQMKRNAQTPLGLTEGDAA